MGSYNLILGLVSNFLPLFKIKLFNTIKVLVTRVSLIKCHFECINIVRNKPVHLIMAPNPFSTARKTA